MATKTMPKTGFDHIRRIKDIKQIKLVEGQNYRNEQDGDQDTSEVVILVCPLSKAVYNGFSKFLFNWNCGCIYSKQSSDELKNLDGEISSSQTCVVCNQPFASASDIIDLNLTEDQKQKKYEELVAQAKQ